MSYVKNDNDSFKTYDAILAARSDGLSIAETAEKCGVGTNHVKTVMLAHKCAMKGDLESLARVKTRRVAEWAKQFLPPEAAEPSAPLLSAAAITGTAMALLVKSMEEDGENTDFIRGVLALYKALTAPGAEM